MRPLRRRRRSQAPGLPTREMRATRWPRELYRLTKQHIEHGTKIPPALWDYVRRILAGQPIEDPNGNPVPIDVRTRRLFIALLWNVWSGINDDPTDTLERATLKALSGCSDDRATLDDNAARSDRREEETEP